MKQTNTDENKEDKETDDEQTTVHKATQMPGVPLH